LKDHYYLPRPINYPGEELEAFLARKGVEYDRIFYVGDGTNDFCPILRLKRLVLQSGISLEA